MSESAHKRGFLTPTEIYQARLYFVLLDTLVDQEEEAENNLLYSVILTHIIDKNENS